MNTLRFFLVIGLLSLVFAATATASSWIWTETKAEDMLQTEYQTVDPWALKDAMTQTTLGLHPNVRAIAAAKRAARPDWAHCRGVGYHEKAFYARFYCSVRLSSWLTDWEATRKVTLRVTGRDMFAVANGWH